jgi:hypothetical protein
MAILAYWAYARLLERTAETNCTNNMRSIGLALANYHDTYKRYPSPDFGGHSWRIRCLPFIQASVMYSEYRFDESWNSPANISLDKRPLYTKKVLSEDGAGPMEIHGIPYAYPCRYDLQAHGTSYLMIVGENAFGKPGGWRHTDEITDGLDSTLAAAETVQTNIHWLDPTDFNAGTMSYSVNDGTNSISSSHPRGPAVLFCDGEVYRLNPTISSKTLRAMVTINGGERIVRDELVRQGMLIRP